MESKYNQFIHAVGRGKVKKAAAILDEGFEIDTSSPRTDGFTGLHFASQEGDEPMVSLLLSRGASLDLRTGSSLTALMLTSNFGHTQIVKRLLAAGAQTDLREPSVGATALMMAASTGRTDVVDELIAAGASTNQVGEKHWEGKTAMLLALEGGHAETANALAPHSAFHPAQISHVISLLQPTKAPTEAPTEQKHQPTKGKASTEAHEAPKRNEILDHEAPSDETTEAPEAPTEADDEADSMTDLLSSRVPFSPSLHRQPN